ncbi:MAG: tetratricopeptide repeat protein [Acidobacteriota bacterium]
MESDTSRFRNGVQLLKAGKLDEAIAELAIAATTGEDLPVEHFALAVAYEKNGDARRAVKEFQRFLEMNPDDANKIAYAKTHIARLQPAEPVPQVRPSPHQAPAPRPAPAMPAAAGSAESWNERGKAAFQNGIREALSCFERAVAAEPGHPGALYNAAVLSLVAGDAARAHASLATLVGDHPEDAEARELLESI